MPFLTDLTITSLRSTNNYSLDKPLHYFSGLYNILIIVPEGTETDFASIPGFIKFWMDDDGGFIRDAAVVHDYLYSKKSGYTYPTIDREAADNIIIEGMKELGASLIKCQAVYYALRSFGSLAYKKN